LVHFGKAHARCTIGVDILTEEPTGMKKSFVSIKANASANLDANAGAKTPVH
jgi:hypothetical protein